MRSRSITYPDGEPSWAGFSRHGVWRSKLGAAVRAGGLSRAESGQKSLAEAPRAQRGFVLASAIFLLVVMAALAAFIVQVTVASETTSAQDIQGARAYQAARLGIESGLYSVQVNDTCPGGTLTTIAGLTGFKVTWACVVTPFKEGSSDGSNNKTIYQITSTACTTTGASCPSATPTELQSADYTERQLVAITER